MQTDFLPYPNSFNGVMAYVFFSLILIMLLQPALGQNEYQYPQDNDADYYYNYYTPEKSVDEAERQYPQDNDADYYQNYYYDYRAGEDHKYQDYYYPGDDEEHSNASDQEYSDGYEDYYRNRYPAQGDKGYYEKAYPEDNDATYYKDRTFFPSVNQYD